MIIKARYQPLDLIFLRYLNLRMSLPEKEAKHYLNLEKGFKGELQFDNWLEQLSGDKLILNDLLLETNNTTFQIDTLLVSQDTVYLFEVKNYEGDFYIDADRWYTISGKEIKNPLLQLQRCESLLRQLLQPMKVNLPIETHLIFINPEFTLYQASKNLPIIFPAQLNSFMKILNMKSSKLNQKHTKLAEKLVSIHLNESPYPRIPVYDYNQLKKGIVCLKCNSFLTTFHGKKLVCDGCGHKEYVTSCILRTVEEFKFLFPDKKITTNTIFEWCQVITCKKRISRILNKNYKLVGLTRSSHYVDSHVDVQN